VKLLGNVVLVLARDPHWIVTEVGQVSEEGDCLRGGIADGFELTVSPSGVDLEEVDVLEL
jgi:hypothetical protein